MPRERNSVKMDLAVTLNDDVKDFIIRMIRYKLNDMQFEKEYYESELAVAQDQKKVNLSNGRKYADLYQEKLDRLAVEMENFNDAIDTVNKSEFSDKKFKVKQNK